VIAALYVETNGVYYGLPDVDPWDEARDARLYAGPWPVVAHPPCARWSIMGLCRGYGDGDDGGCFEAALSAVRTYGGVLEHPRYSLAWRAFGLPKPSTIGWTSSLLDEGFTCEVDQRRYGHEARKPTWLYFVGAAPPPMRWGKAERGERSVGRGWGGGREHLRSRSPLAFRDALLDMARSCLPRDESLTNDEVAAMLDAQRRFPAANLTPDAESV
jgi:hypothetical protein